MSKRTKVKIILFIILAAIGLVAGFFFTGFINLVLTGGYGDISQLHPAAIMESLAANDRHRLLTLCVELVIVAGIAVVLLMSRRETFESDVRAVTESINTPIAIGQGQHGTARWLRREEQCKAFSLYRFDPEDMSMAVLLNAGARDRKEVDNYNEPVATAEKTEEQTPETDE